MNNSKQLTNLNKFKKASIPILEHALIEPGELTVTNLETTYKVNHDTPINGRCLIHIEGFVKIARKYDIKEILVAEKKAVLVTEAGEFSFTNEDISEFPHIPTLKSETGYFITKEMIDTFSPYMSEDDLRTAMQGIYFGEGICATDGHRMKFDLESGPGKDEEFILSSEAIKLITGNDYQHCEYEGSIHSGYFGLKNEFETIIYRDFDAQYPNFRSVIPSECSQTFEFDSKEVKPLIEAALIAANDRTKLIKLSPDGSAIKIYAEDLDMNSEYDSKPFGNVSNVESDEFSTGFNGGYFLDMLKNNSGKITMKQKKPNQAAIINGNELLMPVMLNTY